MSPTCPRCGQMIQPEDSQDGLTFQCSACSAVLRLRAPLPGFTKPDANEEAGASNEVSPTPDNTPELELDDEVADDATQEPIAHAESTAGVDGDYEMLDDEEDELELADNADLTPLELEEPEPAAGFADPLRELTTDGISVNEFPGIESSRVEDATVPDRDDSPEDTSRDAALPHVSVPDDAPDTIDFSAAAEEVRESLEQGSGPTEQALHEEVSELLDKAEGGMLAEAAALGAAGMAIVGGIRDASDDSTGDEEDLAHGEVDGVVNDDDQEYGDVEFEFEFEVPDEDVLDDNPELPVEPASGVSEDFIAEATEDASCESLPDSVGEFDFEAAEDAEEAVAADGSEQGFGAGITMPPTTPLESMSPLAEEPFELPFDDVDESDNPLAAAAPTDEIEPPIFEAVEMDEQLDDAVEESLAPLSLEEPVELDAELTVDAVTDVEEIDFSAPEVTPMESRSLETPSFMDAGVEPELAFETPELQEANEFAELTPDVASEPAEPLLEDDGAGLTAAAGAAALGAAAFSRDDDADEVEQESTEIVFDRHDDEPADDIDLDFGDAARPTFEPDKIDADDLALEPVDAAVAALPPAGNPLETGTRKPFEMKSGKGAMAVAPAIPRQRNLFFDLFKLAFGAAIGLSIAQGILWWAMKIDPLGLAHRMPAAFAIAVPEELRNSLPPLKPRRSTPVAVAPEEMPAPAEEDARPAPTEVSSSLASDESRDSAFAADTSDDLANDPSSGGDFGENDGMSDLESDDLASPSDANDDSDAFDDVDAAPVPFAGYGLVGVAETSPYDLGGALAAAKDELHAFLGMKSSDRETRRAAMRKLYRSFVSLADHATTVERGGDSEQVLDEVRALLEQSAESPIMNLVFGKGGKSWISKNDVGGVVVAGKIISNDPTGDMQEIQLQLDGTDTLVIIATRDSNLRAGDSAIVLGVLVDDPSDNLKNYNGLDDMVIWSTDVTSNRSP